MHFVKQLDGGPSWCGTAEPLTRRWSEVTCAACQTLARKHIRETYEQHLDLFPLSQKQSTEAA